MPTLDLKKIVKDAFVGLSTNDILKNGVNALIGVSDEQAKILQKEFGIISIYDLAFSDLFSNARYIQRITNNQVNAADIKLSGEKLIEQTFLDNLVKLKDQSPALLTQVGAAKAKALEKFFSFKTISNLAYWLPANNAVALVNHHLGIGLSIEDINKPNIEAAPNKTSLKKQSVFDPESPQELVPTMGEYPVEVVYYNSVVLTESPKPKDKLKPLEGKIRLSFDDEKLGFDSPGFGAILTFKQSWFSEGITLGGLQKSIALAPGESTKIAIIDWQSRTRTRSLESTSQTEELSSELSQQRAISEVANATANELQTGTSTIRSVGTSSNAGVAVGGIQLPFLFGGSASTSQNYSKAKSVSTTGGQRDISSSMQQNINSATQQNSFSSRNRRASMVTEVSQSETETITTRSITNYNHMHALTLQYWEVVQTYTTELKLDRYKRCIFIPMDVINFEDERIIEKFKHVLYAAAKSNVVQQLLSARNNYVLVREMARPTWIKYEEQLTSSQNPADKKKLAINAAKAKSSYHLNRNAEVNSGLIFDFNRQDRTFKMLSHLEILKVNWTKDIADCIKAIHFVQENGTLQSVSNSSTTLSLPLSLVVRIEIEFNQVDEDYTQKITLVMNKPFVGEVQSSFSFDVLKNQKKTVLLEFEPPLASENLGNILNEDALYYSQEIWMNMDSNLLSMQLSQYKVTIGKGSGNMREVPLCEYIDPSPVAVMGNCLGFIFHDDEDQEWKKWVAQNIDENKTTTQQVALPTEGIFGEAVLGRSNSAEKLDMTRFWNWQDSPIPIQAPDIAAIQAGQHDTVSAARSGNLDNPVLNIMNPQPLPDPTGMQGVLQAITTANMFRDLSGLSQTSALAQNALNGAVAGATAAGNQAGANMATAANFSLEVLRMAASLAPMLAGLPPANLPASKNITNNGAALMAAKDFDSRQIPTENEGASQGSSGINLPSSGSTGRSAVAQSASSGIKEGQALDNIIGNPKQSISFSPSSAGGVTPTQPINRGANNPASLTNVRDILDNVVENQNGEINENDLDAIANSVRNEITQQIIPDMKANASDFNKLKPVIRRLMQNIATTQLTGVDGKVAKEVDESMKVAEDSMRLSIQNTLDNLKSAGSAEDLKQLAEICADANLLGFDGDTFNFQSVVDKLNLTMSIETDFTGPGLNDDVKTGEIGFLKVFVELAVGNNDGFTLPVDIGINVTGGEAFPSSTGKTSDTGRFTCSIRCTDRSKLAIDGLADSGISGISSSFIVNILP